MKTTIYSGNIDVHSKKKNNKIMEVRVMTLTINGDMSKKEANLYVQQLKEKNPDKYFKTVDITVDGEYVDVNYTYDEVPFERIRRITGYLVGTVDRFNDAKRAEVNDRVKHSLTKCCSAEEIA